MTRFPRFLTLVSVSTLALGAAACSNGHSPTEPALAGLDAQPAAAKSMSSISSESRGRGRGGDDGAANDRRGRRNEPQPGDDRGRRGRGRGADDPAGDDRGNRQEPARAQELEGAVVSVRSGSLILAGGTRITVNAQTQWSSRGDLFSLDQVARSLGAGKPTKVEGRGVRQADGSILAQTIKAENEDEDERGGDDD